MENEEKTALQGEISHNFPFDYSYVSSKARIASYDDLKSAPRITVIEPADTNEFIENLASTTYTLAQQAGGTIPYTVVREVTENFIHARFKEIVVSILDKGNTIRFADQGPGIPNKDQAQRPGFSSAVEPMKAYIRGVGSGLPIVKDYLSVTHGSITIEDNLTSGSVITISNIPDQPNKKETPQTPHSFKEYAVESAKFGLSNREKTLLTTLLKEGPLGVTVLSNLTSIPQSSTHSSLVKLEKLGLIQKGAGQKRFLTEKGYEISTNLS